MSILIMARSSSNRNSASALASSVLPTPVGPRNRNEPDGRSGSEMPALDRRTASDTACTALAWPTIRWPSSCSIRSSLPVSPSSSRPAGIPVQAATTSATSSGPTSSLTIGLPDTSTATSAPSTPATLAVRASSPACAAACARSRSSAGISPYISREAVSKSASRCARSACPRRSSSCFFSSPTLFRLDFSRSQRARRPVSCSCLSARSARSRSSRSLLAGSASLASASSSIFIRSTARCSSSISTGRESISIRSLDAASSMRSMALSGRNRAVM